MTRFLNLDLTRANEALFWPSDVLASAQPRPAQAAVRHIAPDRRPVCRWQIDDDTDPAG